jgi:phosphatidylglycerol lysyltransferase
MSLLHAIRRHFLIRRQFGVQFVSIVVAAHGFVIIATTLLDQAVMRHNVRITTLLVDLPLLIGMSLLYLSTLLLRRKRTAWLVTVLAYSFYLGLGISNLIAEVGFDDLNLLRLIRVAVLPALILVLLFVLQPYFVVKSDTQGFRVAARFSFIIIVVALLYGVIGFSLLDKSDFHQEISTTAALHYTVDQFDLTTVHPVHPYTFRAKVFTASLSFISIAAVAYAALSLFQPLRQRLLTDQAVDRQKMIDLMTKYPSKSESFFKVWPKDKHYFFDYDDTSGLAYAVHRGVALCLGDPAGRPTSFKSLLMEFEDFCFGNDWLPAHVHVLDTQRTLFEKQGYALQKIGEEAVVSIVDFQANVAGNKYFRHIRNKFTKQGYNSELLQPPHHPAVISRLKEISDDWLSRGGRDERGFAMGYFTEEYMQMCNIMVIRDAAGTIQAFLNQIPADFDTAEATYDLLRYTHSSIGNSNDFLLLSYIDYLQTQQYSHVNLGLCPLYGLDDKSEDSGLIDGLLRFAFANGDRFYSFSGLSRFKSKYEPEWRDSYLAYKGGIRGITKTANALMRSMRVKI